MEQKKTLNDDLLIVERVGRGRVSGPDEEDSSGDNDNTSSDTGEERTSSVR